MASQDDTPQQHPTSEESAEPERNGASPDAQNDDALSDASETIVHGDHAAGTDHAAEADDGAAATDFSAAGSSAATAAGSPNDGRDAADGADGTALPDDGINHDDWDAAFADAAGETPAGEQHGRTAAASDVEVVPGGHPSLAQRSTLPMRRASTMPDVSGYGKLSDEEQEAAGSLDAPLPLRDHAVGDSDSADDSTANDRAANDSPADTSTAKNGSHAAGSHAAPAFAAGAGAGAGAAAAAGADRTPKTSSIHAVAAADADDSNAGSNTGSDTRTASDLDAGLDSEPAVDDEISEEEARRRAEERERAGSARPVLARVLQVMIAVFFPVMLLAAAVRAVATPLFLWVEYHRPGFPDDSYGFSTDDRMTYGSYAVDYLHNFSGARYLGDLVTAGGEPLYLATEVGHMADVKTVLTIAFSAALAMALLSLLACFYLAKRSPGGIRRAFFSGAVATLVLIGALIVTAVLGWESFFTQVHAIFFTSGTWTFRMDDTLIRLFPAQFWMDAGIATAGLVLLTSVVVLIASWPTKARRERSRLKAEAARRRYLDSLEAV